MNIHEVISTQKLRCAFFLALGVIGLNSAFAQEFFIEGNSLSDRFFNTDSDPTNAQFVVDFPITQPGTLREILTWGQNSSAGIPGIGESFIAYVLRPAGTNFQVMLKTEYLTVTSVGTNTFAAPPFILLVGDQIAHYGRGIPLDYNTGGPSSVYDNQGLPLPVPNVGDILELPGPVYPLYNDGGRNYAMAVGVSPLPSLSIAVLGNSVVISWPGPATDTLLQTTNLNGTWTTNTSFISADGTNTLALAAPVGSLFFRLRIP
jgi:hypothetical protein